MVDLSRFVLFSLALCATETVQAQNIDDAWAALKAKDYTTAYSVFKPLAENGNVKAQEQMGWLYWNGQGVAKEEQQSALWFRKAAEQGNAGAQYGLAMAYAGGKGVPKDEQQAIRWYGKAAENGHVKAQTNLAELKSKGQSPENDESLALLLKQTRAEVPVPKNLVFTVPAPDLKKELAAFHGKWVGSWGGSLDAVLIIKSIDTETAKVLYAWGDAPDRKFSAGFQEYDAKVLAADSGEIEFGSLPGPIFSVKAVNDSSSIQITRAASNGSISGVFRRSDIPSSRITNDEMMGKALESAWEKFCQAGYCGGYPGKIHDKTDDVVTVWINGNKRYLKYYVIGEAGNYLVRPEQRPT